MRLHRLGIKAFGPFAGEETIDFDSLAQHGLFLLNGPTGSGKTSILDAVCFALYGSLPGARLGSRSLKSHHAPAGSEPAVALEFTAQGRRFEVRRTPEWSKPSARSSAGWVTQKASTHLRELVDGEWRALTSRNDEAGALLGEVLGMAREQFTRVVLLPQGEFASFLRAKASERVDLLEKLFGTQRFDDIEAQLAALAQAARSAAEDAERSAVLPLVQLEAEIEARVPDAAEAARRPQDSGATDGMGKANESRPMVRDPDEPVDPALARALFDWAEEAFRGLRARAEEDSGAARTALTAFRSAAATAERDLDEAAELAAARARREAWDRHAAEHAQRLASLRAHRAASGLEPSLAEADRTAREARAARAEAQAAFEAAVAAGWAPAAASPEQDAEGAAGAAGRLPAVDEVRVAAAEAAAEAAVLSERLPAERELDGLIAQLAGDRRAVESFTADARRGAEAIEALGSQLAENEAERARLGPAASALPFARIEAENAEGVVRAVEEHAQAVRAATEAEAEYERCRRAALDAKATWLDLRERRLEQAAAELAAQLATGEPCPVCGSEDHPAPSFGGQDPLLLVDAERTASRASDAAGERESRARDAAAGARARLAGIDGRGGATDPDKAVRILEEKLAAVRTALDAESRLARVTAESVGLAERRDAAAADREKASVQRIRAEETLGRRLEDVRRRTSEVEGWRAGFATIAARQPDAAARARTLGALEESLGRHRAAAEASSRAAGALGAGLESSEFGSEAAVRTALLPEAEAARRDAEAAAYEAEGHQLGGLFDSAAVRRALHAEERGASASPEHLASLRAAEAEQEQRLRGADLAVRQAEAAEARRVDLLARFEGSVPGLEEARRRAQILGDLSRTVRGQGENQMRMSLHSYVLAARLEQVAVAASERLLAMSDGRFSLEHSDALAARGAASGLGLEVVDGWTGQKRDPSTLSGGESFMASLALALGLADVVQHESGGIDIETLFVDEGFGSLDEQALEQVMDAIEGLRAGGRVVGLVSHVSELKQRIPAQIRVSKGRSGSHVESVGVAAAIA